MRGKGNFETKEREIEKPCQSLERVPGLSEHDDKEVLKYLKEKLKFNGERKIIIKQLQCSKNMFYAYFPI